MILAVWPILAFLFFLKQGFNPYEELTSSEMAKPNGSFGGFLWASRLVCHFFITAMTVYLIALWFTMFIVRRGQTDGDRVWIALKVSSMPFGALYFQEGLYFDCGICLQNFQPEEEVVGLVSNPEAHVFHPRCLIRYL